MLDTERLSWSTLNAKRTSKVSYGGGKFAFQTPTCPAHLQPFHKFPGSLMMSMEDDTFSPHFRSFVSDIERSAIDAVPELDMLEPVAHLKKITAFSNAHVFDNTNAVVHAPETYEGRYLVACILQLDGAWANDSKWGLKFKVLQVKIYGELEAHPRPRQVAVAYGFVDDPCVHEHPQHHRPVQVYDFIEDPSCN